MDGRRRRIGTPPLRAHNSAAPVNSLTSSLKKASTTSATPCSSTLPAHSLLSCANTGHVSDACLPALIKCVRSAQVPCA